MVGLLEDEVTVTSGLHAQAERTNKQTNRGERAKSANWDGLFRLREKGGFEEASGWFSSGASPRE